jgi:signal peptidase II
MNDGLGMNEGGHARLRLLGLTMAVLAFVADQASKFGLLYGLRLKDLASDESVPLLPFLDLRMVWNPGVSYGLFAAEGLWGTLALVIVTAGVVAFMGWYLWKATHSAIVAAGCGLIIGGGLGNLLDRLVYGKVADFFHFFAFDYHWYVFNIADVAVTLGAVTFIYDVLKPSESSKDA